MSARARGKLRYEKLLREAAKTITGERENLPVRKRSQCRLRTENDHFGCDLGAPHSAHRANRNVPGRAAWEPFCELSGCAATARR